MVFKRRDRRGILRIVLDALWPKGGWARAFEYVKHRLRRLPDTPEKISRGIWAGVFTTFTPFYGLHFIIAALVAKIMRGNILAALLATFFGNPLTYVPIGVVALNFGNWLLGNHPDPDAHVSLARKFTDAGSDLWSNLLALFTHADTNWARLGRFYDEVFFPYLIGGILPGLVVATTVSMLALPVIRAHQNRRRKVLRARLDRLSQRAGDQKAR